jgi:phytanoyl-CoA hydroxylase
MGVPISEVVASYDAQGYAVMPALLDAKMGDAAIAAIEVIQQGIATLSPALTKKLVFERALPARKRNGMPPDATGDAIFIIGDLPAFDPAFVACLLEPHLLAVVRALLGTDDIRYHFSNVTMKRPHVGSGISWHRDYPNRYICPAGPSFLRLMICLDGMDAANGATTFAVGSHLIPERPTEDTAAQMASAARSAEQLPLVGVICPPGSVVAIHPRIVHGGANNQTARHRRNIVVQWGRADDPVTPPADGEESLCGFSPAEMAQWQSAQKKGAG